MSEFATTAQERIGAFWSKYSTLVKQRNIRADAQRWYFLRAAAFVKAMQLRRLAVLTPADIDRDLAAKGGNTCPRPWQSCASLVPILRKFSTATSLESTPVQVVAYGVGGDLQDLGNLLRASAGGEQDHGAAMRAASRSSSRWPLWHPAGGSS